MILYSLFISETLCYSEKLVYFIIIIFNQSQFAKGEPEAQSSMSITEQ